jgi:hypothetical protein
MHSHEMHFCRQDKLHVADWEEQGAVYAHAMHNESIYTHVKVERAREAYEFLRMNVYPSQDEVLHMLRYGIIYDIPHLTRADLQ